MHSAFTAIAFFIATYYLSALRCARQVCHYFINGLKPAATTSPILRDSATPHTRSAVGTITFCNDVALARRYEQDRCEPDCRRYGTYLSL